MHQVYESQETEAIILIYASNVFNALNQEAALCNIQHLTYHLTASVVIASQWNMHSSALVMDTH